MVRRGVRYACTLGRRAVDAVTLGGILLPSLGTVVVIGLGMRATTEWAADCLGTANR